MNDGALVGLLDSLLADVESAAARLMEDDEANSGDVAEACYTLGRIAERIRSALDVLPAVDAHPGD